MSSEIVDMEQDDIKCMFERLISNRDKLLSEDDQILKDIEESKDFQSAFCCSDPIYKQQISSIISSNPDIINKNTVGAYLYSCFQPETVVEIGCVPSCITGLKNPNISSCEMNTYEKNEKGELIKLHTVVGDDANVFMASGQTITKSDKQILYNHGIKVITTYKQDTTTINYILSDSIPTDSPPIEPPQQHILTNINYWAYIWLIISAVIVIFIGFFLTYH